MPAGSLPDLGRTFTLAWTVLSRSWRGLLLVSVLGWVPFGVLAGAWLALSVDFAAFTDITSGNWDEAPDFEAVVRSAGGMIAGLILLPLIWAVSTCWVNGASACIAHGVGSGQQVSAGAALSRSARKLHRTLLVYVTLTAVGVILAVVVVGAAGGAFLLLDATLTPLWALAAASLVVLAGGVLAVLAYLWVYARWAVAGQAAVLDPAGTGNPLSSSARLTSGRRLGTLGRVLLLSIVVSAVVGTVSSLVAVAGVGPLWLVGAMLLLRMLLSFATGAGTSASITPLYDALAGTQDPSGTESPAI